MFTLRSALLVFSLFALCAFAGATTASADFGYESAVGKLGGAGALGISDGAFDSPADVATGPGDTIYVLDYKDCGVSIFTPGGEFIRRWSPGCQNFNPGALGASALDVDMNGNVYIATVFTVNVYNPMGVFVRAIPSDFSAPPGQGLNLNSKDKIVVEKDSATPALFVTDYGQNRVTKFSSAGEFIWTRGRDVDAVNPSTGTELCTVSADCKAGTTGNLPGEFSSNLRGIALSPDGSQLAVVDYSNFRVQLFDADTGALDGDPVSFSGMYDVAYGENGDSLWMMQRFDRVVHEVEFDGDLIQTIGDGSFSTDPGQFLMPVGVERLPGGGVLVADLNAHRVQGFDASGTLQLSIGKNADIGAGLGAEEGEFNLPQDLAIDAAGTMWFSDYENHRIQSLTSGGNWSQIGTGSLGQQGGQFYRPMGVAREGNFLWVADAWNHRIQKFNATTGAFILALGRDVDSTTVTTTGEICNTAANCKSGTTGTGNSEFNFPTDIAIPPTGTLMYVLDRNNNRISVFDRISLTYQTSFSGSPTFNSPTAIDVSATGDIYVSEFSSSRLQLIEPLGYSTVSTRTRSGALFGGIAVVGDNVYASSFGHQQIYRYDLGIGDPPASFSSRGSNPGEVADPSGLASSPVDADALWVADSSNHRFMQFDEIGTRPEATITLTQPAGGSLTIFNTDSFNLNYTTDDGYGNELSCDRGRGQTYVPEGTSLVVVKCTTPFDGLAEASASITRITDTEGPVVNITAPTSGLVTDVDNVVISYDASDTLDPNAPDCSPTADSTVALTAGVNTITVDCEDWAGNVGSASVNVTYNPPAPPTPPVGPSPPPPPSAPTPEADCSVVFPKTLKFRGRVTATVTCTTATPVTLTLKLKVGKKTYTARARTNLGAAGVKKLTVRFPSRATKAALAARKKPKLNYSLLYSAKAGKSGSVKHSR